MREHDYQCTFVTNHPPSGKTELEIIPYPVLGGARRQTHYCARTFENAVAHAHGVYTACKGRNDLRPDLIVGHSGFGSTLFLRELFDCPIINHFEYFYHPHDSDMDFRPSMPPQELDVLRSYCRNAMLLLDLENCDAGYSPTLWQKSRFPDRYQDKIDVIFDGIDTSVWRRREEAPRTVAGAPIPVGTRIVTYVSRGLESMRGFDIFMQVAKRIYEQHPEVLFVVVGADRVAYGGDLKSTGGASYKEFVLAQDSYDLTKFRFTGLLPPVDLASLLSISDLHIYLTVPFVLSWSLFNALACGAIVVASDTSPVREIVRHGENGLLAGFFDIDRFAELSLNVLREPERFRHLREAGSALINETYSLEKTLPRLMQLYERVCAK